MKERIVKKILRHTKRIKKTKVHIKKSLIKDMRVNRQTCQLYADPHVHGFSGKNYNAQTVGDWVLYKGKNLSAHYRGKSMGVWVGAIKFGIHLFHHYKIYTIGFKFDKLLINDKVKKIIEGTTNLKHGGAIIKKNNIVYFSTDDGEEVELVSFGSYFNAYVKSNTRHVSGLCSDQFVHSHFFKNYHQAHKVKFEKKHCERKEEHRRTCLGHGLKGDRLRFCIQDLCGGMRRSELKRIVVRNIKEKKKEKLKELELLK